MGNDRTRKCRCCGKEFNTDETRRIYGSCSRVYMLNYCSARCYTKDTVGE